MTDPQTPGDVYRDQFEKLGKELLDKTNKPNIITFEQFKPYISLFQKQREPLEPGQRPQTRHQIHMSQLFQAYIRNLEINIYEPTIVIQSADNPQEIAFLDRMFTRIQSDVVPSDKKSMRDTIPAGVSRVMSVAREQQVLDASLVDLMNANATEEQNSFFARAKIGSAFIKAKFMEVNMTQEQKTLIMQESSPTAAQDELSSESEGVFGIVDDDD